MKRSKIAAIVLSAALALSMTACASTTEETTGMVEEAGITIAAPTAVPAAGTVAESANGAAAAANIDEAILGTWTGDVEGIQWVYTFNADGTCSATETLDGEQLEPIDYTYTTNAGTLTLTVEFEGQTENIVFTYTIDGNTLSLDDGYNVITCTKN